MSNKKPYVISFSTLKTKNIKMKPEVFVFVLLISVSGSADEEEEELDDHKPPSELSRMFHDDTYRPSGTGSSDIRMGVGDPHYYYDHIIDLCLQRLKQNKKVYSMEASINKPEQHSSENPVKGTIVFDGLHSLSRYKRGIESWNVHIRSKRLVNGDLKLRGTFEFGNISGIGNFSGLNSPKESQNDFFKFHPKRTMIDVSFIITKDPSRKRVSFKLRKHSFQRDSKDTNVTLLLEQKALISFERVFNDLSDIIHERLFSTARKDNPYLDKVMDNVIHKLNQNAKKPVNIFMVSDAYNKTAGVMRRWNMSFSLHSLMKLSKVQVLNETNGEADVQTTIQFGNVSGWGFVLSRTTYKENNYFQTFNFTSTPVIVEALFYLPRNKSFQAETINFLAKPIYTMQVSHEFFRSYFQQLLEAYGPQVYREPVYRILNETYNEVFPKTNFSKNN